LELESLSQSNSALPWEWESALQSEWESALQSERESELALKLVWALDSVWVSGWIHLR
jgi:hypothetical protein